MPGINFQADATEGEILARTISKAVNSSDKRVLKEAARSLAGDHRTLQQSFMSRFVLPYLETLAENGTDDRNRACVELAQSIMALPAAERALPFT